MKEKGSASYIPCSSSGWNRARIWVGIPVCMKSAETERVLPHAHTPKGWKTVLYDLEQDPHENHPLEDAGVTARMRKLMVEKMIEGDAPVEQYTRMGLEKEYAEAKR